MLPKTLSTTESNVYLRQLNKHDDLYKVASLFLDDRLWTGGFDACGHGQPDGIDDAYDLAVDLYSEGDFYSIWVGDVWVGTTGVLSHDEVSGTVMMGRTLVSPDFWGQRVNYVVKKILLSYLFEVAEVNGVEVTAIESNRNSLKALEKYGFVEVVRWSERNKYTGLGRPTVSLYLSKDAWFSHVPMDTSPIQLTFTGIQPV